LIDYTYGPDGNLRHATYEFRTFNGYDSDTEEFTSTVCVREYDTTEAGELILRSKVTTDLSTGESVERGFYEPELTHWMTLTEAREIQAEQAGTGQPATRPESKSEGGDKPQPEAEGRSR
jgi:hypothetical protein